LLPDASQHRRNSTLLRDNKTRQLDATEEPSSLGDEQLLSFGDVSYHPEVTVSRNPTLRSVAVLAAAVLTLSACTSDPGGEPAPVPPATSSPSGDSSSADPVPTDGANEAAPGDAAGAPSGTPEAPAPAASAATSPTGPVQPSGEPTVIATGLALPWSVVRMESGAVLVSERDTARVMEIVGGANRVVGEVPGVVPGGEGGLLGLAVLAEPTTTWLYAYTTAASDNRVLRMPLAGAPGSLTLGAPENVLTGIPKAGNHNGGRIAFGPDGMLYITAGDAGARERSQNTADLGGKILRVTATGEAPPDNPFPGSPVWSYGHRNPQGLDWDRDGRLWASEFGQNTWDELNLIEKGVNYGWPVVEGISSDPAYRNPVQQWSTAEASPSGLLWTRDTLFMAALRGERLWSIIATPESVTTSAFFATQFGRLRDVIEGPNETVWILTNNTGRAPRDGDDKILEVPIGALGKG
jgi:glucose/arabinose dehydrogenase